MAIDDLGTRRAKYFVLSGLLAQVSNTELTTLLGDSGSAGGWGTTATIVVGRTKVFVKRVPVMDVEYDNMFSTANHYDLPTFYNYGVGSAGFGVFRELVAHVKTTNWVLDGSEPNFPLMYHYRIMPTPASEEVMDEERHNGYVKYWNGDPGIARYKRDRHAARFQLVLCLEHFPHVLGGWLPHHVEGSEVVIREMRRTLAFLREHGIVHFDVHFGNILVNHGIPYLSDFGLVLDKSFALSTPELAFFKRHADYDDAEFFLCLGSILHSLYRDLSATSRKKLAKRYGIGDDPPFRELIGLLMDNMEEIRAMGIWKLPDAYISEVARHRGVIDSLQAFFNAMRENPRKDTRYPERKMRQLFQQADAGQAAGEQPA